MVLIKFIYFSVELRFYNSTLLMMSAKTYLKSTSLLSKELSALSSRTHLRLNKENSCVSSYSPKTVFLLSLLRSTFTCLFYCSLLLVQVTMYLLNALKILTVVDTRLCSDVFLF